MLAFVFLSAVLAPVAAGARPWDFQCKIVLRPQAVVYHANPVLADVADLSGPDESLVKRLGAVALGPVFDARVFSRGEIAGLIRGAVPGSGPVEVTGAECSRISLARRTPAAAEISKILKLHLSSITAWRDEEIEIRSIDNLSGIAIPVGDVQLRVVSSGLPANWRRLLLSVEASIEGKTVRTFWVKADVRVHARVVEMARPVRYQTVLSADDLRETEREIEDPRADCIRSAASAVGMIAKRALPKGGILTSRCVSATNLVHSGDTVRLTARINGIQVSTLALALQDGKLGERIKIRNIDSDRALVAVVTGEREVKITQ